MKFNVLKSEKVETLRCLKVVCSDLFPTFREACVDPNRSVCQATKHADLLDSRRSITILAKIGSINVMSSPIPDQGKKGLTPHKTTIDLFSRR